MVRWSFMLVGAVALAGCGGGQPAAGGAGAPGAFPPAAVKTVMLSAKPVPQTSEFVAVVQSLRSLTIQPQVEGFIRRIFVKSGDRVRIGQALVQIDADKQTAAVSSLEAARAAREADVGLAKQRLDRAQKLLDVGAVSQQEAEQAETAYKTAEAQLNAIAAQIRESQVQLNYYRVTAPAGGVIGDVPVRLGERVDTSTVITTIDAGLGLEAYISVPLEESTGLRIGLPVEVLDRDGQVISTNPITFIAPRADDATQSVLVKSLMREGAESLRVQQYVRARIVWSQDPVLTVPVGSVTRMGGAYFCFVAAPEGNGFVARQRPIEVGPVTNDEYTVRKGLVAGDRVIVSGIQKLGDGAPVKPE